MALRFVFLSKSFFEMCAARSYVEIEQKVDRPYVLLLVKLKEHTWGVPLRSHIKHSNAFWTDKEHGCGIDYSKAVIIDNEEYIDNTRSPHIRDNEFKAIKGHEFDIQKGFESYISKYEKAKRSGHPRYKSLLEFSTLQNYSDVLGIE